MTFYSQFSISLKCTNIIIIIRWRKCLIRPDKLKDITCFNFTLFLTSPSFLQQKFLLCMVIKETINDASYSNTDKLLKCTYKNLQLHFVRLEISYYQMNYIIGVPYFLNWNIFLKLEQNIFEQTKWINEFDLSIW